MSENSKAILEKPGTMVIVDCERPTPRPHEVVVKIARVGMCGSDIHGFKFGPYIPPQPGQIVGLGHEPSGVVTEVGANVTHLKVGDRVCLEPGEPCYRCEFCLAGHYNVCPQVDFLATAPNYRGAFAKYMAHPAQLVFKLPDDLTMDEGALVEPASVATHAVEMAGALLGKTVVILGGGAQGGNEAEVQGQVEQVGLQVIQIDALAQRAEFCAQAVAADLRLGLDIGVDEPEQVGEVGLQAAEIREYVADGIVDLVGNACHQPAQRSHFFRLHQAGLGGFELLIGGFGD